MTKPTKTNRPNRFVFMNPNNHCLLRAFNVPTLAGSLGLKHQSDVIQAPTEEALQELQTKVSGSEKELFDSCTVIETSFCMTYAS